MSKFEDDLKIAQKTSETELVWWLSSIGLFVTKNLDPSYEQKFLTNQQQVHELIFGSNQDGAVNLLFSKIKAGKLKECIAMYQLLYQLSPGDSTYYQGLLKNSQNKHLVEEHLLPTHIQLLLTEQNINSQFGHVFKDNIINNELHVNSQLLFWINLLNSAVNFKESNVAKEVNMDLLENFQYRLKNKMPSNDYMLSNLTFNPYTILVRRILQSVIQECFDLQSTRAGKDDNQVQILIQLQKMVILLQEYTLFQYIFNINQKELKLSIDQTKKLMRLKHFTLMDTQVQLIYLTILFNSMYGFRLETLFQQFNSIFIPLNQIQTPIVMQRSFFFEAGRQQQILTYPQALFLYLQSAMTNFQNDRQYSQLTLLSYCSTLVLYQRWPYAQHEIQLYDCALRFDQAINWFIVFYKRFTKETYILTNDSLLSSFRQTYLKYFMNLTQFLGKSNYQNQIRQIRQYVPNSEQPLIAIKYMNKAFNYHVNELSEVRSGMSQHLRFNYPFFTYIFKQFLANIAKIRSLTAEDHQAVIHLLSFFISTEENSVFSGLFQFNAIQQTPSYTEVSQFCLKITQTLKENDYSLYDCRPDIIKIITLLLDYDTQSAQPYVDILQKLFQFEIDFKPSPIRTSYNPNRDHNITNRHSIRRKKSPVWQIPQKEHETFILFWIMYQFSCFCDTLMVKEKRNEPQTEWPRKFASCANFISLILMLIVLFSVCCFILRS